MNTVKSLLALLIERRLYTFFAVGLLVSASLRGYGQCIVYKDADQQIVTTCEFYNAKGKSATAAYRQETYLGSPFLTYPVWQKGSIQVKKQDKVLPCDLAYNVVSNEVMCRFEGDTTPVVMTPEFFTINGSDYTRQPTKRYTTVLYNGKTKLLMSQSRQIEAIHNYGFTKNKDIIGAYQTTTKYYIQKLDSKLEGSKLSKKSILSLLASQHDKLKDRLPTDQLSVNDVIEVLKYYDSLENNSQSR
ncbi:hypothetical protein GCM10027592_19000 [Spirosoma flavus]